MAKIIVFGTGQWAELAHFYLNHDSSHEVVAFTVDLDHIKETTFKALPVISFEEVNTYFPPNQYKMFIPMSFKKMNHLRAEKYFQAKKMGYELISYVSSKSTIWPGFSCGDNCFIFEDNTIQPFVSIGNNVTLWSGNHIGHHTKIGDHVMLTSHVVISGCCTIEAFCFFGVNSTVRDETYIANDTLVGMGVNISNDTSPFDVYRVENSKPAGIPSNRLRSLSHKSKRS